MSSSDLHFDVKKVDVKKAEEYFRVNKEFHSFGYKDSGEIEHDTCNNKIFLSSREILQYNKSNFSESDLSTKFMDLAEIITKNIHLFCQIDYLIRRIPIEETRNVEIKLLVQNLIYHSSCGDIGEISESTRRIFMYDNIPLSILGLVAAARQPQFTIYSTKETAALCSLFVKLCHTVGLMDYVYLVFISNTDLSLNIEKNDGLFTEELFDCVGIVTEKGDIDSAIDTFLYSSSRFPWNIKAIYVQECILDQFKKRIEWKTKEPSSDVDKTLISSCSSIRVYEDKMYLFEFVGNIKTIKKNSIIIEAYRTNKELLSLMSAKILSVSLWSSDVAESNEIAFNIKANIIWINDFAHFDGPPVASQAFYSSIGYKALPNLLEHREKNILKIRMNWKSLDVTDRYFKVWKATREFQAKESFKQNVMLKCFNNSTITVGNKICTVLRSPVLLYVQIKSSEDFLKHVNFILQGGAVYFLVEESDETAKIIKCCEELESSGAPLAYTTSVDGFTNKLKYDTKVIWSSIGTIFAN